MNLPNYFLADLPPEAELTPAIVTEACQTLKRNREHHLAMRSTADIISTLAHVGSNWRQPEYALRRLALERGPGETGFSRKTLARGLDALFQHFTAEQFGQLMAAELGHAARLDNFVSSDTEFRQGRMALAQGPALLAHIAAGNLPNPAILSLTLGLLVRSAQFLKCASGASLLPRLFAHSIYEADPKLGSCLELAEWRGGHEGIEGALFVEADCITATGSDETLTAIRARLPVQKRFLGYGHRLSFGFVAAPVLHGFNTQRVVSRAAADVTAWNQLGCLSPHLFYVEQGGETNAERFAEQLAAELALRELTEPRGPVPTEVAAGIASRRGFYEVRAAHSLETKLWHSEGSTAWTVAFEADARFQMSCLHRFVYVKPVANLAEALRHAESVREFVSTVGVAVPEHTLPAVAMELARWGATRVCPLGKMQEPPLAWRHDGRPALAGLVTWTDLEMGG